MVSTEDRVKREVLELLFNKYEKEPRAWVSLSTITRDLNKFNHNKVVAAVDFLTDEKYIKKDRKKLAERYRITSKGVQEFSPSIYRSKPLSSVSISPKGGVIVFGDNIGTIKQETVVSFEEITQLVKIINTSSISDLKKRDLIADAETVRAQLTKPKPDKSILQKAWESLKQAATINEAIDLLRTIGMTIAGYLK